MHAERSRACTTPQVEDIAGLSKIRDLKVFAYCNDSKAAQILPVLREIERVLGEQNCRVCLLTSLSCQADRLHKEGPYFKSWRWGRRLKSVTEHDVQEEGLAEWLHSKASRVSP